MPKSAISMTKIAESADKIAAYLCGNRICGEKGSKWGALKHLLNKRSHQTQSPICGSPLHE